MKAKPKGSSESVIDDLQPDDTNIKFFNIGVRHGRSQANKAFTAKLSELLEKKEKLELWEEYYKVKDVEAVPVKAIQEAINKLGEGNDE